MDESRSSSYNESSSSIHPHHITMNYSRIILSTSVSNWGEYHTHTLVGLPARCLDQPKTTSQAAPYPKLTNHFALRTLRLLESAVAFHDLVNLAKMGPGIDIDTCKCPLPWWVLEHSCDTLPYCSLVAPPVSLRLFLCLLVEFSKHCDAYIITVRRLAGEVKTSFGAGKHAGVLWGDCEIGVGNASGWESGIEFCGWSRWLVGAKARLGIFAS